MATDIDTGSTFPLGATVVGDGVNFSLYSKNASKVELLFFDAMKSVVVAPGAYDWEGDRPLRHPYARTVIYEMHLAGFTRHPNSGVPASRRGTYAGLIDKIPYLADLGITAVELLPIFQHRVPTVNTEQDRRR
jgi:pullulanase/glycogen debranching enzyme